MVTSVGVGPERPCPMHELHNIGSIDYINTVVWKITFSL
jgi:hypothetical protein